METIDNTDYIDKITDYIEKFEVKDIETGLEILLDFVFENWDKDYGTAYCKNGLYVFATGGWKFNESLIYALKRNEIWRMLWWRSIVLPGGFYAIANTKEAEMFLEEVSNEITEKIYKKVKGD